MRSLQEVRADFDDVDAALLALVRRRLELAREAGVVKRALGLPVFDPVREAERRAAREAWCAAHDVDAALVDRLFAALIEASRDVQG